MSSSKGGFRWLVVTGGHRSRIELEDKAKAIVSDWGTESLPR